MLLKKIPPNPNAKVTQRTKHEFWVDMEKDPSFLKPLIYEKMKRAGKDSEFKNNGVIHEESFEFDEMKRRRNEYVNYCIKKIVCAIKDEPMPEKDAKKSPLNVQIASSKRRHKKHSKLKEVLNTRYGMSFVDNPNATARLSQGLSSVKLESQRKSEFGLSSVEDIKKFNELNGFDNTPVFDVPELNE